MKEIFKYDLSINKSIKIIWIHRTAFLEVLPPVHHYPEAYEELVSLDGNSWKVVQKIHMMLPMS